MRLSGSRLAGLVFFVLVGCGTSEPERTPFGDSDFEVLTSDEGSSSADGFLEPSTGGSGAVEMTGSFGSTGPETGEPVGHEMESGSGGSETGDLACTLGTESCECLNEGCEDGLECIDGLCIAPQCPDFAEPNDVEYAATFLGEKADSEDETSSFSSVLRGSGDVDWLRFAGQDGNILTDIFGTVDPTVQVSAGNADLRVCMYGECIEALESTTFDCPEGTELDLSPEGRPGCCASLGFTVPGNCENTIFDDSMDVYIRLENLSADCVEYTIDYRF